MSNPFFDHPILNSPYECPARHWELDDSGQPTQKILEFRRDAKFITPIPKPKKRKQQAQGFRSYNAAVGRVLRETSYTAIRNQQIRPMISATNFLHGTK